jgi:hypothetical protein
MALQSQEQLEVQRLEEMLQEWKACCAWCHVNECIGEEQHELANCTQEGAEDVQNGAREMLKQIRWDRYSCCFNCGVPQSICASYTERLDARWEQIPGAQCQFAGVLVPSVVAIWVAATTLFTNWVQGEMQKEGAWQEEDELPMCFNKVVAWMASLIQWGGIQSNKMCWVFVQFTAKYAHLPPLEAYT